MDSLGSKFQAARESQGATLEQMSSRIRIQVPYLQALEEEAFDRLPERVFTKGFIRSYARALNLDEEDCLRLFAERFPAFSKETEKTLIFLKKDDEEKERASRILVVLLIGGMILLGGVVLYQQQFPGSPFQAVEPANRIDSNTGNPDANQPGPPASGERQGDATSGETAETVPPPDVAEEPEESPAGDAAPASSTSDLAAGPEAPPLVLEMRTLDQTWVKVRSDEHEPREALLRPGEIVRWQAREGFLVTLGNAGGVEVRLNGELQGPFGEKGVVVRDVEIRP